MLPMLVRAGPSDGTDVRARKGEGAEAAFALLASAAVAARGAPVASSYKSVSKSAADMEVMKAVLPSRAPGGCCSVAALQRVWTGNHQSVSCFVGTVCQWRGGDKGCTCCRRA